VTPRLVAYCAERSASAACAGEDGQVLAYAKLHAGDGAERERRSLEAARAADDGVLRVPRVIGASALDGAVAVEAVAGRRLDLLRQRAPAREHDAEPFGQVGAQRVRAREVAEPDRMLAVEEQRWTPAHAVSNSSRILRSTGGRTRLTAGRATRARTEAAVCQRSAGSPGSGRTDA